MAELRRYATLLAAGTAGSTPLVLALRRAADGRLAGSGDWTPVAGDVTFAIDGAVFGNVTNLPTYTAGRWRLILTAAELTGKSVVVKIVDQDGPAIQDELAEVQTFGDAAAFFPDNYAAQLLPSALVAGRVDASVGAMAAGTVTAAAVATDAIDADALAGSAVSEIQAGLATAGAPVALTPAERNAIADAHFARPLPASPAVDTAGEALRAAAAQGIGDWDITGDVLTLKDPAGVTLAQFDLTPAGGPYTARVRQ